MNIYLYIMLSIRGISVIKIVTVFVFIEFIKKGGV